MRCALLSHRRADAVGTDEQVRFDRFTIGKTRRHRTRILREVQEPASAVIVLGWKRIAQQAINALPSGRHLRAIVGNADLPVMVQNLSRGDNDTERLGGEPQALQAVDQLVLRNDPGAAAGQLALHPLVDVDVPPRAPQLQGTEQAAHRAADDDGAPSPGPGQLTHPNLFERPLLLYIIAKQHWRNSPWP